MVEKWYKLQLIFRELQLISFTFNLRFLNELRQKVCLSKTVGFSIFDSVSVLLKPTFLFNKMQPLFSFKTS